ncbi:MAG: shikimate dehydrogenase [bacterium]|nr:shikimate dehydrogenase [bacterium]
MKKYYCIMGDPVDHSLSPFIMNRAFSESGWNGEYTKVHVTERGLPDAVDELRNRGFSGANITYPHKESVLSFAGRTTHEVEVIGASNTLTLSEEGITAYNTDAVGTVRALTLLSGFQPADKRAFIFGAGGAARAAAYGLMDSGVKSVTMGVRNEAKAMEPVSRLRSAFIDKRIDIHTVPIDGADAREALAEAEVIINATPVGMSGTKVPRLIQDPSWISKSHVVFDFVYHPRNTTLLENARERGATTLEGVALLVAQAQASFRIWAGTDFSLPGMFSAVTAHLREQDGNSKEDK